MTQQNKGVVSKIFYKKKQSCLPCSSTPGPLVVVAKEVVVVEKKEKIHKIHRRKRSRG